VSGGFGSDDDDIRNSYSGRLNRTLEDNIKMRSLEDNIKVRSLEDNIKMRSLEHNIKMR